MRRRAALAVLLAWPALVLPAGTQAQGMAPLMGRRVFGPKGEEIGRLVDVVLDDRGQPRAVVADIGGFLGIGMRRIAIDWRLLRFLPDVDTLRVVVERDANEVAAAREYQPGDATTILQPK